MRNDQVKIGDGHRICVIGSRRFIRSQPRMQNEGRLPQISQSLFLLTTFSSSLIFTRILHACLCRSRSEVALNEWWRGVVRRIIKVFCAIFNTLLIFRQILSDLITLAGFLIQILTKKIPLCILGIFRRIFVGLVSNKVLRLYVYPMDELLLFS